MTYKLNNVDISTFGAVPSVQGQGLALQGIFDMPKRKGTTEYNWGTSIEPFVDAEDIELDGRMLTLSVVISTGYKVQLIPKINAFKAACLACTTLSTEYAAFQVVCKDEITVVEYDTAAVITASFWQNTVVIPGLVITPSGTGNYRLDSFDLQKDFGITVSKVEQSRNVANRIDVTTTEFYSADQYRELRDISMTCFIQISDVAEVYASICQFQAFLCSEGTKQFFSDGNYQIELYFRDGFKVQFMAYNIIKFSLKGRVVSFEDAPNDRLPYLLPFEILL